MRQGALRYGYGQPLDAQVDSARNSTLQVLGSCNRDPHPFASPIMIYGSILYFELEGFRG